MKIVLPSVVVLLLSAVAPAQLAISELLIDPSGTNEGEQIIELVNTSGAAFTPPAGWAFCVRPSYPAIPTVQIPKDGVVRVHIGASGTNTSTDWYLPTIPELSLDDEFALYSTSFDFGNPARVIDFASWGDGRGFSRILTAVFAGVWPGADVHLELPAEGSTLAWFGTGTGPDAYYPDSTPTLGSPNEPAAKGLFGAGCEVGGGTPAMDFAAGDLAWLNESFTLQITGVPGGGAPFGLLGFSDTLWETIPLPLDLASIGFPDCKLYVSIKTSSALVNSLGVASWDIDVPLLPSLVGVDFFTQGVVLLGAEAGMSNAVRGTIGGLR